MQEVDVSFSSLCHYLQLFFLSLDIDRHLFIALYHQLRFLWSTLCLFTTYLVPVLNGCFLFCLLCSLIVMNARVFGYIPGYPNPA